MSQDYLSHLIHLKEVVNYEEGSIVSRTIVEKNTGTVSLFSFAEGQGLGEHTAPFDALVYVYDGEAEVVITGKPFKLQAGDFIVMPANNPHSLKAIKNFKMMLIMIRS
jgi:quercetin dioxygenase-like cupin family protein